MVFRHLELLRSMPLGGRVYHFPYGAVKAFHEGDVVASFKLRLDVAESLPRADGPKRSTMKSSNASA
jgi:hypothetical protein